MTQRDLSEEETKKLQITVKGCQEVLDALSALITKFSALGSDSRRWRDKPEQVLQKLRWDQAEVKELRLRITSNVTILDTLNSSISRKQTQASMTGICQHLEGVRLSQQHQEILDWLSPHDYSSEQSDTFARRQGGTGTWLLESPEFGTWISGTRQTLFCPGIPGAGKTIMSSIVIDHLTSTFREANVGVAFIYCRYKVRMEQTPFNVFSSLLRQLMQGHDQVSTQASKLFEAHSRVGSKPSRLTLKEVYDLLEFEASRYSKVFVVLDALDECSDTDGTRCEILSEIRTLQSKQPVYLAATSRLIPNIIQDFKDAMRLDIKASEADVRRYLQSQFHRLPSCVTRNVTLQQSIEREIVHAVDGMFLLAQLHLDSLEDKVTPRAVNAALADLPKGSDALDVAYNQAMERINDQKPGFRRLADQALTWIVFALRPLTVKELQHALAVELGDPEFDEGNLPDPNEVIAYCAGLVVVDEESQITRLVHYTTQEYFVRIWERRSIECHASIATICLAYLSFGDHAQVVAQINDKRTDQRPDTHPTFALWFRKYPLLRYSAKYWTQHATGMSLESMKPTALEFLSSPSRLNVASELLSWISLGTLINTPSRVTALQFAAVFGSKELVEALLNTGLPADAKGDARSTPLHSAIRRGDAEISKLLMNRDDVDVNSMSEGAMTPLLWAVVGGYDTIVADLLAHPDIDVNGRSEEHTPLCSAACEGYNEIFRMLLAHPDIDVNGRSEEDTPLFRAAGHGYDEIVRMLLAHPDIDVNGGSEEDTPLSLAALRGYDEIVRMLLAHPDIEINAADHLGSTALKWAARWGQDKTIKLLLTQQSIDINAADSKGFTPALCAMRYGHISTCKLLLSQDHVIVHPPSHYPPSSDKELSLAVMRLWAMWDEGRLPEYSEAEE